MLLILNTLLAAVATMTPQCAPNQVTDCKFTDGQVTEVSLQSPSQTIYFEVTRGQVTDFEVYPYNVEPF